MCMVKKKQAGGLGLEHSMRSHTKLLADSEILKGFSESIPKNL